MIAIHIYYYIFLLYTKITSYHTQMLHGAGKIPTKLLDFWFKCRDSYSILGGSSHLESGL